VGTLYVEDLFALNFLMNTFLFYVTARLTSRIISRPRLFAGGALAAVYSLVIFLPGVHLLYTWFGKLIVSFFLVWFTFRPGRPMEMLRLYAAFFLASFFLAGTIFALHFFGTTPVVVRGGAFYIEPPRPGMLFAGVLVTFLLITGVWHFSEKQRQRSRLRHRLVIKDGDKDVTLWALVDTGNNLREPVTGKPLSIVNYNAVRGMLPELLQEAFDRGENPVDALLCLDHTTAGRFGIAPYRSLENAGMLITFRPEEASLHGDDCVGTLAGLRFAITSKPLSLDNDVEVLLHPHVFDFLGR
jgi:stage II sporulation protein GA (sporulation sigma-E factor processing peptidase)